MGLVVAEAWKWAPLTSLLWWWVAPAALAAAAGARFWPALSLQLSRAYQVGVDACLAGGWRNLCVLLTAKRNLVARAMSADLHFAVVKRVMQACKRGARAGSAAGAGGSGRGALGRSICCGFRSGLEPAKAPGAGLLGRLLRPGATRDIWL